MASLFAGVAVPLWVLLYASGSSHDFLYPTREWHVHEMLFGFLPAVMAGFLLTAVPNWTERPPLRGIPLLSLSVLWLAGRLLLSWPWPSGLVAALVDGSFLAALAAFVWWEWIAAESFERAPIGVLISLYAATNLLFHWQALGGAPTDLPERLALAILMLLLTVIGGRLTTFTRELLGKARTIAIPEGLSRFDGVSIGLVVVAVLAWIVQPKSSTAGWLLIAAGALNLIRLWRWHGWLVWREGLVLILHVGYGWLVLSTLLQTVRLLGEYKGKEALYK